jgi:uncharacterized protein involved in exopolysaccharide biosynthesis
MKGPDPKTSAGLSDRGGPISVGKEYGEVMAGEQAAQHDFREGATQSPMVANLRLLWESRRFLGRVAGAGLLFSALIAFLIPNRYQSVTRLMPLDKESSSALATGAADPSRGATGLWGKASEILGLKTSSHLLAGVLKSRSVADTLIQKFDLRKVYGARRIEDTRKELAARTDISMDRHSQIITISVTDKSPQRAAAMTQAYVEELNRTLAEVSTSPARRERILLERRLQAVNQDLETAEKEFSEMSGSAARRERILLERRLQAVTQDLEAAEKESNQFPSRNTAIDIKEPGKARVDAAAVLQGQYIAARSELEAFRQLYADVNVRVRSFQARVAELGGQLEKVGRKDESFSLAEATQGNSQYPSIRELLMLGAPYADLYRKTKVEEAVFETLTREYELAKVQEAKEIPTVRVLDSPKVPEKKSFAPRTVIVLLGTALAFLCGVTWVFGRAMWEQTHPSNPGKVLAREVFDTVKAAMPWASR